MDLKRKVLIVDDQDINRAILRKILEDDFDVFEACNGQEAIDILKRDKTFSLAILDLVMPIVSGYDIIKEIREYDDLLHMPIVATSSIDNEKSEIDALLAGASLFFAKPYNPAIIKIRLRNLIDIIENATMINTYERDSLTRLLTKEVFIRNAEDIIENNPDVDYDIICADVDNFKLVNDLFGRSEADRLLVYIGQVLRAYAVNNGGIACRVGADNFLLIAKHRDSYDEFAELSKQQMDDYPLEFHIVLRYGIYHIYDKSFSIEIMSDRATLALEENKGNVNTIISFYNDEMRERLLKQQFIVDSMNEALEEHQFVVYLQPKYDIQQNTLAGAEALVRWIHPEKGFIRPNEFIPLFEKNGFITKLDRYVWDETCKIIKKWLDEKGIYVPVSVNVSRADIYMPDLPKIIYNIVTSNGLSPSHIHLEITESAYTENPDQLINVVTELRNMGFGIEMDDFGSGYSSLNMLSKLPIDVLKLDIDFIRNDNGDKKNILNYIMFLAKWLDLLVVAEGVEQKNQVERLRDLDCDYVQGYYFSRPLPEDDFTNLLYSSKISTSSKNRMFSFKNAEAELKVDSLTNLMLAKVFENEINKYLIENIYSETTLILIEINNLSNINRKQGNIVGDDVLCRMANRLREFIDNRGIISRITGNEFGIFIKEIVNKEFLEELGVIAFDELISLDVNISYATSPKNGIDYFDLIKNAK